MKKLMDELRKYWDKKQNEPYQYVIVYKRTDDDSIIGYHLSTFCTHTKDILEAKRYSGDNPYPQMEVIVRNLSLTLAEGDNFEITKEIKKEYYNGLTFEDIYIDAVYLMEGTPKQEFRMNLINMK